MTCRAIQGNFSRPAFSTEPCGFEVASAPEIPLRWLVQAVEGSSRTVKRSRREQGALCSADTAMQHQAQAPDALNGPLAVECDVAW